MRCAHAAVLSALTSVVAVAQSNDLYDVTQLETIDLAFASPMFWSTLVANYDAGLDQNLAADLTYKGVVYPGVGVRIKGKTSFNLLPPGSQKASFNIELDFTDPNLDLGGYKTLNLNNAFEDPTFCREVAFFNFLRDYMPAPRANHVVLRINGQDWGVYANVQQYNATLLREFFASSNGARWKAVESTGGALQYLGTNPLAYQRSYELKDDGGLPNPWQTFIDLCNVVANTPIGQYATLDAKLSVDSALWCVAGENLFMDKDSYIAKGADFYVYLDPRHGQAHLNNYDGNESFGVALVRWPGGVLYTLPSTFHFGDAERPVLQRLMQDARARERYYAHLRAMLADFSWSTLGPKIDAARALIDAAVQADPKKIYSYAEFQQNFASDIPIQAGALTIIAPGLQNFVDQRRAFLLADPELGDPPPVIDWVQHTPSAPQAGQSVQVSAQVRGPSVPVAEVLLYSRLQGRFISTPMFDDGLHGDGASGDDVYGATLPIVGSSGAIVEYYVGAASGAADGAAMVFEPRRAEGAPLEARYALGATGMRITEYMYSGAGPEFFELTNLSTVGIDLTGWSCDDDSATPGVFDLSPAGVVASGQSIVITEGDSAAFSSSWGLSGVTVLGLNTANLSRNDAIHVFDSSASLVDRLVYGDQNFPGSVRAQNRSASGCELAAGADDAYRWVLASASDAQGSWSSSQGDLGSPGAWFSGMDCTIGLTYCTSPANSTGASAVTTAEGSVRVVEQNLTLRATPVPQAVLGLFLMSSSQQQMPLFLAGQGTLCVGPPVMRMGGSTQNTAASNMLTYAVDFQALPGGAVFLAGQTWNFQAWHRDVNPTATTNLSSGLAITFH